ncbi:MAG: capsule assembly Wzi family protein [Clostridium sp.]|nr:capsule assembly Wzi family protein [Clostridium sp.]
MKRITIIAMVLLATEVPFFAQTPPENRWKDLGKGVEYEAELQVTAGSDKSPLWLNANRYGMSSVDGNNGYLRGKLRRSTECDSSYNWKWGYGLDVAFAYGNTAPVIIQQAYIDLNYRKLRLSIGAKERPAELKNNALSSGSQTFGINARPVPQVRLELPDYLSITGKSNWAAIKGHFGYGMLTDGRWQKDYVNPDARYTQKALLHTKAGYLRIGNENKFPLVLEGGLEWACIFGGTSYRMYKQPPYNQSMGHSLKDFVKAIVGGGSDPTDDIYLNAAGNTLGSWTFSLSYKGKDWKVRAYYDHFFEDHSMLFFQYGWLDGLIGGEITLPKNPVVTSLVYEYMHTKYQAGGIYHDRTETIPDQISGRDNYYNHNIYWGWQHYGQAFGNPLYTSPLYNDDGSLTFRNNRFTAHHIGLSGTPMSCLNYRMIYTYSSNWGTYTLPYNEIKYSNSFMVELEYCPKQIGKTKLNGWSLSGAFGIDRGAELGDNTGIQFTLRKTGLLTKNRRR